MGDLTALDLRPVYLKGVNRIDREFYLPCMSKAVTYDRAVGFFASTVYLLAWPSLRGFVERGGRMRVICSPVLSAKDQVALEEGYLAIEEATVAGALRSEVLRLLSDPVLGRPWKVLAALVAIGVLDLRIAFMGPNTERQHHRLFHTKVGIFADEHGNQVVFKGSMNETFSGLSADGNLESVDVFLSWGESREQARVAFEASYFSKLWVDDFPTVSVVPFPSVARDALINAADVDHWPDLVDEISRELRIQEKSDVAADGQRRILRPHQVTALEGWQRNGRRGILEQATGSGKTVTALSAMRSSLEKHEVPLVLVPSELLLQQWTREIRQEFPDIEPQVLVCGGGHSDWREPRRLSLWTRPGDQPRVIVSTMATAVSDDFLSRVRTGDHLLMVVDEVHRIGSPENQKLLALDSGPRLGLSATPRRAGDPSGTDAILTYFNGIIQPPYTLRDAIVDGVLTRYIYHPHPVPLSDGEQLEWERLTADAGRLYAQTRGRPEQYDGLQRRLHQLQIRRARVLKGAVGKVPLATRIVSEHFRSGERWIVYCESTVQLLDVLNSLRSAGIETLEYHTAMQGDRQQTLRLFEATGGVIVSIRCLDEGVDIPSVTHALILASSKNPREFIQRRGRVLRRAPGKAVSVIHDAIVIPSSRENEDAATSIVGGEIARAIEFGGWADNPSAITDLSLIALDQGVPYQQLIQAGVEDD